MGVACVSVQVRGIETVTTFDLSTEEFIINTPCESAQKHWIGGAAQVNLVTANTPYTINACSIAVGENELVGGGWECHTIFDKYRQITVAFRTYPASRYMVYLVKVMLFLSSIRAILLSGHRHVGASRAWGDQCL